MVVAVERKANNGQRGAGAVPELRACVCVCVCGLGGGGTAHYPCGIGGEQINRDTLFCGLMLGAFEHYCMEILFLFWHHGGGGMKDGVQKYWRTDFPFSRYGMVSVPPTRPKL